MVLTISIEVEITVLRNLPILGVPPKTSNDAKIQAGCKDVVTHICVHLHNNKLHFTATSITSYN